MMKEVLMTDNNEKKNARESRYAALHELTHSRAVYVMSFVVPLVIMIAIFIIRDIYPFRYVSPVLSFFLRALE